MLGDRIPDDTRQELRERLYRRRYIVPNAVTLGNMFCGYLAIMYAATGRFEKAILAIAIAILMDGLDGRVARKLNATSKFGMEFDSFSDVVSFGVAPAVVMYFWGFHSLADEFGVFITFIYTLCAASRLARFNIADPNLKSFMGLPTPGAAGFVAAVVNFLPTPEPSYSLITMCALVMLSLAYLMVSRIEFFSIKSLKMQNLKFGGRVTLGAIIALVWYNSKIGVLALAFLYCLSGPVATLLKKRHGNSPSQPQQDAA